MVKCCGLLNYVYGTPTQGRGQYAHPKMNSLIQAVACDWCLLDNRKFGVGNISLADGVAFQKHESHRNGLQVDVRAIRKDGRELPCNRLEAQYDSAATGKLIALFMRHPFVKRVFFNDSAIAHVRPLAGHDGHFHVELR